jgi:tetratricopeptide (TPR) repeat protein
LFFQDRSNDFFSTWLDQVIAIVNETIESVRPRRVILWGQSVGAYAAQVCALAIDIETFTVAISPHLRLDRPRTRAMDMVRAPPREWVDLRERLRTFDRGRILFLLPCFSLRDWGHIVDAQSLSAPNVQYRLIRSDHGIEEYLVARGEFDQILFDAQEGRPLVINPNLLADDRDNELVNIGYEIYEALENGRDGEFSWPSDDGSRNNWWFDIKSRYLFRNGNPEMAIVALLKAISLNPDVGSHYVSLGHFYSSQHVRHLAALVYALARAKGSRDDWLDRKIEDLQADFTGSYFPELIRLLANSTCQ